MKATRGAKYWSRVQNVLSLLRDTGTYRGLGRWWGSSEEEENQMIVWKNTKNKSNKQ